MVSEHCSDGQAGMWDKFLGFCHGVLVLEIKMSNTRGKLYIERGMMP